MQNPNNTIKVNEIGLIDIIINFWKFKNFFLLILIPLLSVSILIENFIVKKSNIEIWLKDSNLIHKDLYPSASMLSSIEIKDTTNLAYQAKFGEYNNFKINFYEMYLEPIFYSKERLINFLEINKKKYNFNSSITEDDVTFLRSGKANINFNLTLPDHPNNKKFYLDYLDFAGKIAFQSFKDDVLQIEKKKLKKLILDLNAMNVILSNYDETYKNNKIIQNLNVITSILNEREKILKFNINFIENLSQPDKEYWIKNKPEKTILNSKYYTVSKFALPLILSIIIHFLYILIKLYQKDRIN